MNNFSTIDFLSTKNLQNIKSPLDDFHKLIVWHKKKEPTLIHIE